MTMIEHAQQLIALYKRGIATPLEVKNQLATKMHEEGECHQTLEYIRMFNDDWYQWIKQRIKDFDDPDKNWINLRSHC